MICEDQTPKPGQNHLTFVEQQGKKTRMKTAEVHVRERIQITGTSPNDHTDNKTLLENQYACGNKHVRINRAFGSVQSSELWRGKKRGKKETHFVRWLGN